MTSSSLWPDGSEPQASSLAPHQERAVGWIARRLARYRGALLADEPGLGKSWVAATVVRERLQLGESVELIVPASLQSMWREVLGVEATLINEEFQVLLANMRDAEITQVFRSSWMGDYNDAHTFLSVLQSNSAANMPRYEDEEFDSLMALAADQLDPEQRKLYLEEAERVMLADYPVIPIYFFVSKHLVTPEVEGWGDNVLDYHYSQQLSFKAVQ